MPRAPAIKYLPLPEGNDPRQPVSEGELAELVRVSNQQPASEWNVLVDDAELNLKVHHFPSPENEDGVVWQRGRTEIHLPCSAEVSVGLISDPTTRKLWDDMLGGWEVLTSRGQQFHSFHFDGIFGLAKKSFLVWSRIQAFDKSGKPCVTADEAWSYASIWRPADVQWEGLPPNVSNRDSKLVFAYVVTRDHEQPSTHSKIITFERTFYTASMVTRLLAPMLPQIIPSYSRKYANRVLDLLKANEFQALLGGLAASATKKANMEAVKSRFMQVAPHRNKRLKADASPSTPKTEVDDPAVGARIKEGATKSTEVLKTPAKLDFFDNVRRNESLAERTPDTTNVKEQDTERDHEEDFFTTTSRAEISPAAQEDRQPSTWRGNQNGQLEDEEDFFAVAAPASMANGNTVQRKADHPNDAAQNLMAAAASRAVVSQDAARATSAAKSPKSTATPIKQQYSAEASPLVPTAEEGKQRQDVDEDIAAVLALARSSLSGGVDLAESDNEDESIEDVLAMARSAVAGQGATTRPRQPIESSQLIAEDEDVKTALSAACASLQTARTSLDAQHPAAQSSTIMSASAQRGKRPVSHDDFSSNFNPASLDEATSGMFRFPSPRGASPSGASANEELEARLAYARRRRLAEQPEEKLQQLHDEAHAPAHFLGSSARYEPATPVQERLHGVVASFTKAEASRSGSGRFKILSEPRWQTANPQTLASTRGTDAWLDSLVSGMQTEAFKPPPWTSVG